ncbi:uncharacterized protein [Prorops nasuta]|uniref:uncharacterized protein n=1 Tax=Prorops nasuta TaxID=863751 RepID=UPI0034CE428A
MKKRLTIGISRALGDEADETSWSTIEEGSQSEKFIFSRSVTMSSKKDFPMPRGSSKQQYANEISCQRSFDSLGENYTLSRKKISGERLHETERMSIRYAVLPERATTAAAAKSLKRSSKR